MNSLMSLPIQATVFCRIFPLLLLCLIAGILLPGAAVGAPSGSLDLDMRRLRKLDTGLDRWEQVTNHVQWDGAHTAAVICDMWDQHWCKGATARVAEMAPRMNDLLNALRQRGVLIIHCSSDIMKYYEGTPVCQLAQAAPSV